MLGIETMNDSNLMYKDGIELLFVWIKEYKNIKNQGFNFGGEYLFTYNVETKTLKIDKNDNYIKNFFNYNYTKSKQDDAINIMNATAIIGKNGTGKTSLLKFIIRNFSNAYGNSNNDNNYTSESIVVFTINENLFIYKHGSVNIARIEQLGVKFHYINNIKELLDTTDYIFLSTFLQSMSLDLPRHTENVENRFINMSSEYLIRSDAERVEKTTINFSDNINIMHNYLMDILRIVMFYAHVNSEKTYKSNKELFGVNLKLPRYLVLYPYEYILVLFDKFFLNDDKSRNKINRLVGEKSEDVTTTIINYFLLNFALEIYNDKERNNIIAGSIDDLIIFFESFKKKQTDNINFKNQFIEKIKLIIMPPKKIKRIEFEQIITTLKNKNVDKLERLTSSYTLEEEYYNLELTYDAEVINKLLEIVNFENPLIPFFMKKCDDFLELLESFKKLTQHFKQLQNTLLIDLDSITNEGIHLIKYFFDKYDNYGILIQIINLDFKHDKNLLIANSIENNQSFSSGEYNLLLQLGRLYCASLKIESKRKNLFLLIDEGDLSLHPEWQRCYVDIILKFCKTLFKNCNLQIILTSHSPFIASDLPPSNVLLLDEANGKGMSAKLASEDNKKTFGANIYELYKDSFFLKNGFIGEFAINVIKWVIEELTNSKGKDLSGNEFEQIEKIISQVADPILKNELYKKYFDKAKFKVTEKKIKLLELEKKQIEERIEQLKNEKADGEK